MRYSGMRIGDTATCERDRLNGGKLFLYFVAEALNTMPPVSQRYFFWSGEGTKETVSGNWRRGLRDLFDLAGIKDGHPHRFRDTFAVELLLASVPIEQVSALLGHSSVRITEKHYAPWVRDRQVQLEASLVRAWARDRIVQEAMRPDTPKVVTFRGRP
ncbi:MAG: hypothetical protein DMG57_31745 [Acidobacteria bacterium]|nr:MAG: hypothetical protein DMG57_31745 [Acidobacteriota bacterium]